MAVRTDTPVVAPAGPRRSPAAWWLLPPVVLALLGGWLVAQRYGFWYDELYTAEVAPEGLGRLFEAFLRGDGTIPYLRDAPPSYNFPYYVVAHIWLALTPFAADEVGLRLLSLAAMIGAVAVFTCAVARLSDRRTGLVAGLVLATNPFVVAYAAEARGYALALLAVSATALGLARWLGGRSLSLYGVAAAAAGLFHWYALLVVAAFAAAAVLLRRRQGVPVVVVSAVAALPALAVVATALANGVGGSGAEWIRDVGLAVPRLALRSWVAGSWFLLVPVVLAVVAGVVKGERTVRAVALCWVGLPVAAVTVGELLRPVYVDRYLLPALAGLAVLAAVGVARWPTVAIAALLVPSIAVTAGNVVRGPREDVRGAVALVAAGHRAGEPVFAAARWDALGVEHYARRHHPDLTADLVLPPAPVPRGPTVWVVRRASGGVKGDVVKLEGLDRDLADRGLRLADEHRLEGRRSVVVVQRWAG